MALPRTLLLSGPKATSSPPGPLLALGPLAQRASGIRCSPTQTKSGEHLFWAKTMEILLSSSLRSAYRSIAKALFIRVWGGTSPTPNSPLSPICLKCKRLLFPGRDVCEVLIRKSAPGAFIPLSSGHPGVTRPLAPARPPQAVASSGVFMSVLSLPPLNFKASLTLGPSDLPLAPRP